MSRITVRPMAERDLAEADRIFRVAFGTFMRLSDPAAFAGDAEYVRARWRADPSAAFGAYVGDELAGSNFAVNWGSVGFFGPLTIRPDLWDRGIGQRLVEAVVARFDAWGMRHTGLFTFPESPKHIALYRRFGFWPRFLTALMSKAVVPAAPPRSGWTRFSDLAEHERSATIAACRELTGSIYDGLDLAAEIRAVADQRLGDTLLVGGDEGLRGIAVCHWGAGTEAGSGACYVKFAAVRPGRQAAADFARLLDACEAAAADAGAPRLTAGVNAARHEAYAHMLERGFTADRHGLVMQRPDEPAYNRTGVYLIDDWR